MTAALLDDLRAQGIVVGCEPWRGVRSFVEHLRASDVFPGHVPAYGDGKARTFVEGADLHVASHRLSDVVTAPGFLEWALGFQEIAAEYLAAPPRLYSLHAFWSRGCGHDINPHVQAWHRDLDDVRFLGLFLFATDVETDGAHVFAPGSHRGRASMGPVREVTGRAGTWFLADTSALHFGRKPIYERCLAWARWGVSERPAAYAMDGTSPVPASALRLSRDLTDAERASTALVVDWSR